MISIYSPLAGIPPLGVGIYDPNGRRAPSDWGYRIVNPEHARPVDFLFAGIERMRPESFAGTLAALSAAVGPLTPGIVVNPENGWPDADADTFGELARGLVSLAARTRVIVVSHGGFRWNTLASALGPAGRAIVVVSVECFYDAPTNARVWQRVSGLFPHAFPSVAGPRGIEHPRPEWSTPEGYAGYLNSIPATVPGVAVWDLTTIRPDALASIRARWGVVRGAPFLALNAIASPLGIIVLGLALIALIAARLTR